MASVLVLMLAAPAWASAATITVNSPGDAPASGTECSGVAGDCSLRQAIAKSGSGDTITIPASIPSITLLNGALTITKNLTIAGTGATANKIDGALTSGLFGLTGQRTVTISGLTLTGGKYQFGAVASADGGNLTLDRDDITNNVSGGSNTAGFGVIDDTGADDAHLTISNSSLSSNQIGGGGSSGAGYGLVDFNAGDDSSLVLSNSTFADNEVGASASGFGTVDFNAETGSALEVSATSFLQNHSGAGGFGYGGAIDTTLDAGAAVSITNSTFSGNAAGGGGGGTGFGGALDLRLSQGGTFTLDHSTFTGNSAGGPGTGGTNSDVGYGGGLTLSTAANLTATLSGDTFSGQQAGGAGGSGANSGNAYGGAIDITGSGSADEVAIVNDTITGSRAGGAPGSGTGSGGGYGGALELGGPSVSLLNDTIDGNSIGANGTGGGIDGTGTSNPLITIKNTIVSGNTVGAAPGNCSTTVTDGGHNLESSAPSQCGFSATSGDLVGATPQLGLLATNGGPVETQALGHTSPAINAGTNSGCPATDARGVPRPQGSACDIGAYELAPPLAGTGSARAITSTTARLAGTATNADVVAGMVAFQYGKTTTYGSETAGARLAPSVSGGPVAVTVGHLQPSTRYHFRILATNPDGTAPGGDGTFTTAPLKLSGLKAHGRKVSYNDNAAATTTLTVLRVQSGYRSGKRCGAKKPEHGKVHRCTVLKRIGSFKHKDRAGSNRLTLPGKISGHKLQPGQYILQAVAKLAGHKSKRVHAGFKLS